MLSSELVEDVMIPLGGLREWELTEDGWRTAAARVADIAAAVRAGDQSALISAAAALAMLSPLRATRIGTEPTIPPTPTVVELVGETIDSLCGRAYQPGPAAQTERDDDRASD